jgi:hypothetical protein
LLRAVVIRLYKRPNNIKNVKEILKSDLNLFLKDEEGRNGGRRRNKEA